jgi:CRISPR-associated protein Csm3
MSKNIKSLTKKILISGEIEVLTGIMIGGGNNAMGIGGPDKLVVRNPLTNHPYLPGSSLKGKMRSLLEISNGQIGYNPEATTVRHTPSSNPEHISVQLFGNASGGNKIEEQRPSRVIVRDAKLKNHVELEKANTDLPYTEAKTEVVIDRITSGASPRTFERVPAGAIFEMNIVLNVFEEDINYLPQLYNCLHLVQDDYLGGSGSRGYGQVKFTIKSVTERTNKFYHGEEEEKSLDLNTVPKDLR